MNDELEAKVRDEDDDEEEREKKRKRRRRKMMKTTRRLRPSDAHDAKKMEKMGW